jgi:hypothetical protein
MNDFKLNTDLDLETAGGDLVTGNATSEHQELLLLTVKGDWKENPTIAVGAGGYLKDEGADGLLGEIKKEFERDGMNVRSVEFTDEKILIDAYYSTT